MQDGTAQAIGPTWGLVEGMLDSVEGIRAGCELQTGTASGLFQGCAEAMVEQHWNNVGIMSVMSH